MALPELTNSSIKDLFLEFIQILKENLKSLLFSTFIALLVGIIWSNFLTPQFHVSAKIGPNINAENQQMSASSSSLISSFLGGGSASDDDMSNIQTSMYSYPVAERMWEIGYADIFFGNNFDQEKELYLRINPSIWEKIGAWILGYNLNLEIGPKDLKDLTISKVKFLKTDFDPNVTLSIMTSSPEKYKDFLTSLIKATDDYLKEEKLSYSNQQIVFLSQQSAVTKDVDIRKALINSIKSKYLDVALLSNDLPYSHRIIDEPFISDKPLSPNLPFIYIFFAFIGFSANLIIIYVRKKILSE
tara:strand:+ start:33820 stop:34722 length:903 start_codon:yes stop_codon:yes gene_type:complete